MNMLSMCLNIFFNFKIKTLFNLVYFCLFLFSILILYLPFFLIITYFYGLSLWSIIGVILTPIIVSIILYFFIGFQFIFEVISSSDVLNFLFDLSNKIVAAQDYIVLFAEKIVLLFLNIYIKSYDSNITLYLNNFFIGCYLKGSPNNQILILFDNKPIMMHTVISKISHLNDFKKIIHDNVFPMNPAYFLFKKLQ